MAFRTIEIGFWTDSKTKGLSITARYLFLYFISSPHGHAAGLYFCPLIYAGHETGIDPENLAAALGELMAAGLVRYDYKLELVWVVNMLRHQGSRSPKLLAGVGKHIEQYRDSGLIKGYLDHYSDLEIPYRYPIQDNGDTLSVGSFRTSDKTGPGTGTGTGTGKDQEREEGLARSLHFLKLFVEDWNDRIPGKSVSEQAMYGLLHDWGEVFDGPDSEVREWCRQPEAIVSKILSAEWFWDLRRVNPGLKSMYSLRWFLTPDKTGYSRIRKLMEGDYDEVYGGQAADPQPQAKGAFDD